MRPGLRSSFVVGDVEDGAALIDRALALNPNLAWAWQFSGLAKVWLGEPEVAIERAARAMRLSPQDPQNVRHADRHRMRRISSPAAMTRRLSWAEAAVREQSNFFILSDVVAAASAALAGKTAEAEKAMARVREINPALRISNLRDLIPIRRKRRFRTVGRGAGKGRAARSELLLPFLIVEFLR